MLVSVQLIKQQSVRDCGLSVISMLVAHYFKKDLDLAALAYEANYGKLGLSIYELSRLSQLHNIMLEAFSAPFDQLSRLIGLFGYAVVVLHTLAGPHYVVLQCLSKARWRVFDPMGETRIYSAAELSTQYQNIVMLATPLPTGVVSNKAVTKSTLTAQLVKSQELLLVLTLSLLLTLLTLLGAALMKLIFDVALPYSLGNLLTLIALGFGLNILLRTLLNFCRALLMRRLSVRAELVLTLRISQKVLRVTMQSFEKLTFDEYLHRFSLVGLVSQFVALRVALVGQELTMLVVSGALLCYLSTPLLGIVLLGAFIGAMVTALCFYLTQEPQQKLVQVGQNFYRALLELTREIAVPVNARQHRVPTAFNLALMDFKRQENKLSLMHLWQQLVTNVVEQLIPLIVTVLASWQVLSNKLSSGSMLLFLSTSQLFVSPFLTLMRFSMQIPQYRTARLLLEFIFKMPEREFLPQVLPIAIKKLTFQQISISRDRPLLLIKDLHISSNIHLTAPNGSGKTSFLKFLSGEMPAAGTLLVNDQNYGAATPTSLQKRTLYLSSQMPLANAWSISSYLTSEDLDKKARLNKAVETLNLESLLLQVQLHLQQPIFDNGSHFSAGQRQLIILLRLFIEDYDVALLDEVTDSIDQNIFEQLQVKAATLREQLFIEVSHAQRYLKEGEKVNLAQFAPY